MPGKNRRNRKGLDPTIVVALIGLVGTITVTLLNLQAIQTWWDNRLNATAVPVMPTGIVDTSNPISSETPTEIPVIDPAPLITETSFPSETPTLISLATMNAGLVYNYATGKPPLQVTFNAHSSYLSFPDGTTETCEFSNVCSYTWEVRQGSTPIYGPATSEGKFAYTFQNSGEYTVVVTVCRGSICNYAAAGINVR